MNTEMKKIPRYSDHQPFSSTLEVFQNVPDSTNAPFTYRQKKTTLLSRVQYAVPKFVKCFGAFSNQDIPIMDVFKALKVLDKFSSCRPPMKGGEF